MKTQFLLIVCLLTAMSSIAQPTISSVSPNVGNPGTAITITGTNFNTTAANNIVYFGAVTGNVTAASATSLTLTAPFGATFDKISVLNTGTHLSGTYKYPYLPVFDQSQVMSGAPIRLDTSIEIRSTGGPSSVTIADIDGDGKPDLITSCRTADSIAIYRNISATGSITSSSFSGKVNFASRRSPSGIAVGDVDGDGKIDIVVCNSSDTSISVYRNTASSGSITTSSLATPVAFRCGVTPFTPGIADFDGDGKLDIAVTNFSSSSISVFRNTSSSGSITTGSFAAKVDFSANNSPAGLAVGDIDGDGKTDIVITNNLANNISVYRNTATSGSITTGSFATKIDFTAGDQPTGIAIGDIDGDGKPDIIESNINSHSNNLWVYRNTATSGTITASSLATGVQIATAATPQQVILSDLDGDGKPDIVVHAGMVGSGTTTPSTVCYLRNQASSGSITTSSFGTRVDITEQVGPTGVAAGDLDGDGRPEIVISNYYSNSISISRNNIYSNIMNAGLICPGSTRTLSSYSSGGKWSSSSTSIATVDSVSGVVTGLTNGSAIITYAYTGYSDTALVTVSSGSVTVTSPAGYCTGGSTTMTASGATTYTWAPSTGLSATTGSTVTCNTTSTRTYSVTGTNGSCSSSATQTITVSAVPILTVTPVSSTYCSGSSTSITASGATNYTWSPSTGLNATTGTTVTCSSTTSVTYTITGTNSGCSGSATRTITVNATPVLTVTPVSSSYCIGSSTTITASGASTYSWSPSNGLSATTGATVTCNSTASRTYTITGTASGCSASLTRSITVNSIPTVSVSATLPTYCSGSSTVITASGANTYSWSPATGLTASTGSVIGCNTSSTRTYTVTGTSTGGCVGTRTQTITVNTTPSAGTITGATGVGIGSTITLTNATSGGTWSSSNASIATVSGGVVTGVSEGTARISYSVTNSCGTSVAMKNINVGSIQWLGTTSTNWNAGANWSSGSVPGTNDNVSIILGTTFMPSINSGVTDSVRNLTIDTGVVVTIGSGGHLFIKGNLISDGTVSGLGQINLGGTTAQLIDGLGIVNNLSLDNAAGATIDTSGRLIVKGQLSVTAGTFTTNDSLVLFADSSATARVAPLPSGASISGQVKVMAYVAGGRRAYRFWSHPFSTYIPLSQAAGYIDITGAGGAANGFTTTASNASSVFRYNPLIGNSSLASDPGWKPFTNTDDIADSNRLHQYQGIRLFVRGAKNEGLGYGTYTPSPVSIAQRGYLNQGNQIVTLSKGSAANQEYNMVGNPYASPTDIGTVIHNALVAGNVVGPAYFVWNPSMGAAGQFQAQPISTTTAVPYYIEACNAFQVRAAYNGATLNFSEDNKGSSASTNLFKTIQEYVTLEMTDAKYHPYDMLYLQFNDNATEALDNNLDATKPFGGADLNFYSLSADNQKMIIDARPYNKDKSIPLGITAQHGQEYIIKANGITTLSEGQLYLHDKLLQQSVLLQDGTEYRFTITDDAATQGNKRFELNMKAPVSAPASNSALSVNLSPNPATNDVKITFTTASKQAVKIRITNMAGKDVFNSDLGVTSSGITNIPLKNLATGIYFVELTAGIENVIQKLVKE